MTKNQQTITIGVLGMQGAFQEHISHLNELFKKLEHDTNYLNYKFRTKLIKTAEDIDNSKLDGLIIGGGESTTMSILLQKEGLLDILQHLIHVEKLPVWGTCAGMILLSNKVMNTDSELGELKYRLIGGLDVTIERNSFGRQTESFVETLNFKGVGMIECVFIRAPVVQSIGLKVKYDEEKVVYAESVKDNKTEAPVRILCETNKNGENLIVGVKSGNILGTSFHPELVDNEYTLHKWFIDEFILHG